jgi:hypothetical protein
MSKKRAFVRYNKKGILAPGSLVVTTGYPDRSQNLWHEVPTHLLGNGITLTSSIDVSTFPWASGLDKWVELSMGCMSNDADYMYIYVPNRDGLASASELITLMNQRASFLGTFELGPLDGTSQTILFNLSPQLATDLIKPNMVNPPCGFGFTDYNTD